MKKFLFFSNILICIFLFVMNKKVISEISYPTTLKSSTFKFEKLQKYQHKSDVNSDFNFILHSSNFESINDFTPTGFSNYINALDDDGNGNLYAGGSFISIDGITVNHIAKWNGSSWSAMGSGVNGDVYAIKTDYVGHVYVAGAFTNAGGIPVNYIAKWDGNQWYALGSGLNGYPYSLRDVGTNIVVGGNFTIAGGDSAKYIAQWNGSSWSSMPGLNDIVYSVSADNGGNIYVGGNFNFLSGNVVVSRCIAKWNGFSWNFLGSGTNNSVYGIEFISGSLYAVGDFTTAGGVTVNHVAKWDGSNWSSLAGGISGAATSITSIAIKGTDLFVGGNFTSIGGIPTNYIAKWDGLAWSQLGSGLNSNPNTILVFDNKLYIGGTFTVAGGNTANFYAVWDGNRLAAPVFSIPAGNYSSLTLNNYSGFVINGNVNISGALTLTSGNIRLGSNNLTVGSISGGSSSNYVVTDGTGQLTINNVSGAVTFPVGRTSYNPLILNNTGGTVDNFSVGVQNSFDHNTPDNNQTVSRQWNISEGTPGGSNAVLTFQWGSSDEGNAVNHSILSVGHWNSSGFYEYISTGTTNGSNPFTITTSPVSSFSPYIIGNSNVLPVELISFSSSIIGKNVELKWITNQETNNLGFDVERKSTTTSWNKIGYVQGSGNSNTPRNYMYNDNNLQIGNYSYRLKQIDYNGNYKYYDLSNEVIINVPDKFNLSQNYPNPFNPSTKIKFEIPKKIFVGLTIFDAIGREIKKLVNEELPEGSYEVNWDASFLPSGIYFYKIETSDYTQTKQMILIK